MPSTHKLFARCIHAYPKYSFKSRVLKTLSSKHKPEVPYSHVVQIGDPVLRAITKPADSNRISSPEIQKIVEKMRIVLDKYDAYGVSAPQLGVPISMFAIQCTKRQISTMEKSSVEAKGIVETPFTVFINPKMRTVGHELVTDREGCCSMNQYTALVTRHKEVSISGLNQKGEHVTWNAKDWNARIVQHEMDHLEGSLFIDKMKSPESLEFMYWKVVNIRQGDFRLNFSGLPGWRQYSYVLPILLMIPGILLLMVFKKL